jgi:hypothetical protein
MRWPLKRKYAIGVRVVAEVATARPRAGRRTPSAVHSVSSVTASALIAPTLSK